MNKFIKLIAPKIITFAFFKIKVRNKKRIWNFNYVPYTFYKCDNKILDIVDSNEDFHLNFSLRNLGWILKKLEIKESDFNFDLKLRYKNSERIKRNKIKLKYKIVLSLHENVDTYDADMKIYVYVKKSCLPKIKLMGILDN